MADQPPGKGDGPDTDPAVPNPLFNIGTDRARRRIGEGGGVGGGDGGSGGILDGRVAHLETRMARVEDKLDVVLHRLGGIASKADMRGYMLAAAGLFAAIVAMLISGLGWLETRMSRVQSSPPAATVIQLPPMIYAPPPAPPSLPKGR